MPIAEDSIVIHVRRLPAETDAMEWGLCVEDCGFADIIGFSSVYYFSRLFKKRIGCPPSAYRQRREDARSDDVT